MRKKSIACLAIMFFIGNMSFAQEINTFMYKVGEYEVILLSEGQQKGNSGILLDATPEMISETMPDGSYATAVNTFLVKTPEKNILIDTGIGKNLLENMKAVGVSPEEIQTVIITHMHGDHTGGLVKDGKIVFPKSTVQLSQAEHNYWSSDTEMNKLPENRRGGFTSARNILKAYEGEIEIVHPGKLKEITGNGIFFIEAYGHTPGHIACLIKSGKDQLLVWADLAHAMAIQMPYPDIAVSYDVDPQKAIEIRKTILEYVAEHKIPIAGMHIPYPGIGRIEKSGKGYVFLPVK